MKIELFPPGPESVLLAEGGPVRDPRRDLALAFAPGSWVRDEVRGGVRKIVDNRFQEEVVRIEKHHNYVFVNMVVFEPVKKAVRLVEERISLARLSILGGAVKFRRKVNVKIRAHGGDEIIVPRLHLLLFG